MLLGELFPEGTRGDISEEERRPAFLAGEGELEGEGSKTTLPLSQVAVEPENLLLLLLESMVGEVLDCEGEEVAESKESERRDFLTPTSPLLGLSKSPLMAFSKTDFLKEEWRSRGSSDSCLGLVGAVVVTGA